METKKKGKATEGKRIEESNSRVKEQAEGEDAWNIYLDQKLNYLPPDGDAVLYDAVREVCVYNLP